MTRTTITPLQPSSRFSGQYLPPNMQAAEWMDPKHWDMCQRQALSIFTDMTNSGRSFSAALGAIYASGMAQAVSIATETGLIK